MTHCLSATPAQPQRSAAAAQPALAAPVTPLADDSLAVLVTSLALRLNRGASSFYQRHFNLAMADFRVLRSLDRVAGLSVGQVASAAEVDPAAASRSLRQLRARGLVDMTLTASRGRAAFVQLTEPGRTLAAGLRLAARSREQRLVACLGAQEQAQVATLLHRLIAQVPVMNLD